LVANCSTINLGSVILAIHEISSERVVLCNGLLLASRVMFELAFRHNLAHALVNGCLAPLLHFSSLSHMLLQRLLMDAASPTVCETMTGVVSAEVDARGAVGATSANFSTTDASHSS
jgi:hypothetical protein